MSGFAGTKAPDEPAKAEVELEPVAANGSEPDLSPPNPGVAADPNEEEVKKDDDEAEDSDEEFDLSMPGFQEVEDTVHGMFSSKSDFDIFNLHLQSQIPLQRLVAVKRLAESCRRFGRKAALSIVPKLAAVANDSEMVIRQTTAENFGAFAEYLWNGDDAKCKKAVIHGVLPHIQRMLAQDAMEVRQAAGRSLVQIARLLSKDEVYEHVLKIPLHMAHDAQDDHKITALPLIGKLADIVGPTVCRVYLSRDLLALSQDTSFRVRKQTVQYFGPICEQLGPESTESMLLPIFLKLCKDSIWSVRKGCVESLIDLSKAISQERRKELIDVMTTFCSDSSRWVRNTAYEMLGKFISTLTSEQITAEFLSLYTNIPKLKSTEADTESSFAGAFCFPGVLLTLGRDRWPELADTYSLLIKKTFKTRKTLACSLHECAKILGTTLTEKYLLQALEMFLKDIDDIRKGVVQSIGDFLQVLSLEKREAHLGTLWELAAEVDANWRFRLYLARQLDLIATLYTPDTVCEQILPLVIQLCDDKMNAVRQCAASKLCKILMHLKEEGTEKQFEDLTKKWKSLSLNRSYARRILFIYSCEDSLDVIPTDLFKKLFFAELLGKKNDPISNVRLVLAQVLKRSFVDRDDMKEDPEVLTAVKSLKEDKEDIDIVRMFCTPEEVLLWKQAREPPVLIAQEVQEESSGENSPEEDEPPDLGVPKDSEIPAQGKD